MKLPTPYDLLDKEMSGAGEYVTREAQEGFIVGCRAAYAAGAKAVRENLAEWGALGDPWVREKCESIAAALEAALEREDS